MPFFLVVFIGIYCCLNNLLLLINKIMRWQLAG